MTPVVYDPVSPYCCRISPFRYSPVLVSNWVHCWRGVCRGSLWVLSSTSYLVTLVTLQQLSFAFSDIHSQTLHGIDQTSQTFVSLYSGLPAGVRPGSGSRRLCTDAHLHVVTPKAQDRATTPRYSRISSSHAGRVVLISSLTERISF